MVEQANVEEVAEAMYSYVSRAQGVKKTTPGELIKFADQTFGNRANKKTHKEAIRHLIDSGRCIYTYFGSTAIEMPQDRCQARQ